MQAGLCRLALGLVVATTLAMAVLPTRAAAQGTAQVGVAAEVSTSLLSIGQRLDLQFGNVVPGVSTVINPRTSANAGTWVIHGARNAEVVVTFVLPTQLSTGTWTLPMSFGPTSACSRRAAGQGGCSFFNPNVPLIERIRNQNAPNNHLYVWIGGTVSPSPTQHTGVYLGTITLTVAYTGN